jgi:plastocyanin
MHARFITLLASLFLSGAAAAETHSVNAYSVSFSPAELHVFPGDTIVWTYVTGYPHTVTSGSNCTGSGLFDSPLEWETPTFTWQVPADASGEIPYFCSPHCMSGMTALIVVEPNTEPCDADVNGDGEVGVDDMLAVIGAWGDCPGCDADTNGDGTVGVDDVLFVIAAWGPCV